MSNEEEEEEEEEVEEGEEEIEDNVCEYEGREMSVLCCCGCCMECKEDFMYVPLGHTTQ